MIRNSIGVTTPVIGLSTISSASSSPWLRYSTEEIAATLLDGFARGSSPSSRVRFTSAACSGLRWMSGGDRRGRLGHAHGPEHHRELKLLGLGVLPDLRSLPRPLT